MTIKRFDLNSIAAKKTLQMFIYFGLFIFIISGCKNDIKSLTHFTKQAETKIVKQDFINDLTHGKFYENPYGFYILLTHQDLYIITQDTTQIKEKFMLHFVKEDNSFDNHSFIYNSKRIKQVLPSPFNDLEIAQISLPKGDFFKIRMGQYNKKGNIWVQEIWPKEIMSNPILKYNNEFKRN